MDNFHFAALARIVACALTAAPVLAAPGEVSNLLWCPASKSCLQWNAQPAATEYRLYRGERASFPCLLTASVDSCDDGAFTTTTTSGTIADTPPAGASFWFLVIARNGTGDGPAGTASPGPRTVNASGACPTSCGLSGSVCSVAADCCSAGCVAGRCQPACCQPTAGVCTLDSDCCSGACSGGLCGPPCTSASQCPGTDTDCRTRTCVGGTCGVAYAPSGTPTTAQTPGDCRRAICDGSGNVDSIADNTDVPNDGNQCTADACSNGTPTFTPTPLGTPCAQNGGTVCDGAGTCVECVAASNCPGTDTECRSRACNAGFCGFSFAPAGTATSGQVAGDCRVNQCDGFGSVVSVADNSDLPNDGNQCTVDACSNGNPTFTPRPAGTPCTQNGGSVCDGSGSCVAPLSRGAAPGDKP